MLDDLITAWHLQGHESKSLTTTTGVGLRARCSEFFFDLERDETFMFKPLLENPAEYKAT